MRLEVRIGRRAEGDLQSIFEFYRDTVGRPEKGSQLVQGLLTTIGYLGDEQRGRRTDDDLPTTYRRLRSGEYYIFYIINLPLRRLTVHEVRHVARRPLQPRTHKQRAAQAERDNQPLHHPPPTDN